MTTTTGLPPELEAYLAAVRTTLADLAPEERDDLLGEVQAALLEAAGEGDGPIAARLGPPEEFAAELRASAGLDPAPPPGPAQDGRRDWRADLRRVVEPLRRVGARARPDLVGRPRVRAGRGPRGRRHVRVVVPPAGPAAHLEHGDDDHRARAGRRGLRGPRPARASERPRGACGVGGVRRADPAARDPRALAHRRREALPAAARHHRGAVRDRPTVCRSSAAR